jgi:hypothetical protein
VSAAPTALPLLVSLGAVDYVGAEGLPGAIERADREMYRQKHQRKLAGDQNLSPVA